MTSWEEQIRQHTNGLTWLVYNGTNRKREDLDFGNYDLVIMTYDVVRQTRAKYAPLIEDFHWKRIILDEAHVIREQNTKQARRICSLQSTYRWCLTGTPVQNRLSDFGSLLNFIQHKEYTSSTKFEKSIIKPLKTRSSAGLSALRDLIGQTTLRRLKSKRLSLPPRTDVMQPLQFSAREQQLYELMHEFTANSIRAAVNSGSKRVGSGVHITQLFLRLRQVCNHGIDLLPKQVTEELFSTGRSGKSDRDAISTTFSHMICENCKHPVKVGSKNLFTFDDCQHVICNSCSTQDGECPACLSANQDLETVCEVIPSTKVQALIRKLKEHPDVKRYDRAPHLDHRYN